MSIFSYNFSHKDFWCYKLYVMHSSKNNNWSFNTVVLWVQCCQFSCQVNSIPIEGVQPFMRRLRHAVKGSCSRSAVHASPPTWCQRVLQQLSRPCVASDMMSKSPAAAQPSMRRLRHDVKGSCSRSAVHASPPTWCQSVLQPLWRSIPQYWVDQN